jgi:hypothetical protein
MSHWRGLSAILASSYAEIRVGSKPSLEPSRHWTKHSNRIRPPIRIPHSASSFRPLADKTSCSAFCANGSCMGACHSSRIAQNDVQRRSTSAILPFSRVRTCSVHDCHSIHVLFHNRYRIFCRRNRSGGFWVFRANGVAAVFRVVVRRYYRASSLGVRESSA